MASQASQCTVNRLSLLCAMTDSMVRQLLSKHMRNAVLRASVGGMLCCAPASLVWAQANIKEVTAASSADVRRGTALPAQHVSPLAQLPPNRPRVVFLRQAGMGQAAGNQGLLWWQATAAEVAVGFPELFAQLGIAIEQKLQLLDTSGRDRVQIIVTRGELMKASRQTQTLTGYRWSRRGDLPMKVDTSRAAYAETQVQFEVRWTHYLGEQAMQKKYSARRKMLPEVGYEEDLIEPLKRTVPQLMAKLQDDVLLWLTMEMGALSLAPTQSH